jgi:hypothetical protein
MKKPSAFTCVLDGKPCVVNAHTRGEARALLKKRLGLKPRQRLPVGFRLQKLDENAE